MARATWARRLPSWGAVSFRISLPPSGGDPESIPEFRPRANGSPVVITPDESGNFRFTFNAPNFTIPAVAVGTLESEVIVRQVESVGDFRPSGDLILAASLMAETIYLGLMATLFGMVLAVPVSFLAARNLMSENRVTMTIYMVVRGLLNIIRSIEPLIWAIIAAAWVGSRPLRRDDRADFAFDCRPGQTLLRSHRKH